MHPITHEKQVTRGLVDSFVSLDYLKPSDLFIANGIMNLKVTVEAETAIVVRKDNNVVKNIKKWKHLSKK